MTVSFKYTLGATANVVGNNVCFTPLRYNHTETARMLIDQGADPSAGGSGINIFEIALQNGQWDTAFMLQNVGVSIGEKYSLHLVCQYRNMSIYALICVLSAQIDSNDRLQHPHCYYFHTVTTVIHSSFVRK